MVQEKVEPPSPREEATQSGRASSGYERSMQKSIVGIFIILLIAGLYLARELVFPILIAFILALTLRPVVRFFSRRRIPSVVTAVVLAVMLAAGAIAAIYSLVLPAADWIARAPEIGNELRQKLSDLRAPMEAIVEAESEIEKATAPDDARSQEVVVAGPGLLTTAAGSVFSVVMVAAVSLVLLTFLLASGDLFYRKLVQSFDTLRDKKRALIIARDVEQEVSRYLFTIAIVNICLGGVVGLGFYALGMPSAHVWGAIAALANFMPYIGAIIGIGAAGVVAIVSFDTIGQALLIPAFYFACTTIEGQFLTPYVVGRRLELNIVAVFISVAFWAWLWGIAGALLAVPILVIIKTVCDQVPEWRTIGNFLSSADAPDADSQP